MWTVDKEACDKTLSRLISGNVYSQNKGHGKMCSRFEYVSLEIL